MTDRSTFRALVLREDDGKVAAAIETLDHESLPEGDVTVDVRYSTLNYKDGMVLGGIGRLVRNYPHVPGIDFAGVVETSESPDFAPGDRVVLTGWRVVGQPSASHLLQHDSRPVGQLHARGRPPACHRDSPPQQVAPGPWVVETLLTDCVGVSPGQDQGRAADLAGLESTGDLGDSSHFLARASSRLAAIQATATPSR